MNCETLVGMIVADTLATNGTTDGTGDQRGKVRSKEKRADLFFAARWAAAERS